MTSRKTLIAFIAIFSVNIFSFSPSDSSNLPNFAALAEQTSPAVVNVSVTKTIKRIGNQGMRSKVLFLQGVHLKIFLIFLSRKELNPKERCSLEAQDLLFLKMDLS